MTTPPREHARLVHYGREQAFREMAELCDRLSRNDMSAAELAEKWGIDAPIVTPAVIAAAMYRKAGQATIAMRFKRPPGLNLHVWHEGDRSVGIPGDAADIFIYGWGQQTLEQCPELVDQARENLDLAFSNLFDARVHIYIEAEDKPYRYGERG